VGASPLGIARAALDADGMVSIGNLPESVAQSWERCVGLGLDTGSRQIFESLTSRELADIIERNHRLTHQALPAMASLYEQIRNTRCMVLLTDAQGLILHSLGDDDFMEKAQRVALQPGVCWDERSKGTNAIGTALFENRALEVCGSEHYFRANNFLTCSATPIRAPGGETVGALDVSGDHRGHQSHTLALVKMTAQTIENHLSFDAFPGAIEMRFHSRPEFIGTLCEGLALLDAQGRVLTANRSAEFQLGTPLSQLIGQDFDSIFDRRFVQALAHPGRTVELLTHRGVRVVAMIAAPQAAARQTRSLARPRREPEARVTQRCLSDLHAGDEGMSRVVTRLRKVIDHDLAILIQGETGTGKEWLARAVHEESSRRNGPFVAVNCSAIPETLIESELFGYEGGAFTGARREGHAGYLRQADGGTLFLDEIGDMPVNLQARLLRVLQDRTVMPLGGGDGVKVDFQLVCATHQPLDRLIAQGGFREDLYYRLAGLTVTLPALRDRSDILDIASSMLRELGDGRFRLDADASRAIRHFRWPGNLRQLSNVLRSALALATPDPHISLEHLPDEIAAAPRPGAPPNKVAANSGSRVGTLNELELDAIRQAIEACGGNMTAAARQLGIGRATLYRKLQASA
jgi:transcriptional regulator of acetoin/glycerol metabolism